MGAGVLGWDGAWPRRGWTDGRVAGWQGGSAAGSAVTGRHGGRHGVFWKGAHDCRNADDRKGRRVSRRIEGVRLFREQAKARRGVEAALRRVASIGGGLHVNRSGSKKQAGWGRSGHTARCGCGLRGYLRHRAVCTV